MKCFICAADIEQGYLCKEHASKLKSQLDMPGNNLIKNPTWNYHCQLCGESIRKTMIEYLSYGYFCSDDINEEYRRYFKT